MMILRVYHGDYYKELDVEAGKAYSIGSGTNDDLSFPTSLMAKGCTTIMCDEQSWSFKSKLVPNNKTSGAELPFEKVIVLDQDNQVAITVYKTGPEFTRMVDTSNLDKVVIGRSSSCDICVGCKQVSSKHIELRRDGDSWRFADLHSANGTYVSGIKKLEGRVESSEAISFGFCSLLLTGNSLSLTYAGSVAVNVPADSARKCVDSVDEPYPYYFKQSPRLRESLPNDQIELQPPPSIGGKPNISWLNVLLMPALTVCVMLAVCFFVTGVMTMLYFSVPMTLIGAVMSVVRYKSEKKRYLATEHLRFEKYDEYLAEQEDFIGNQVKEQRRVLNSENPSVVQCLRMALDTDRTIWSRRRRDADFMTLRVGSGTIPASISIKAPKQMLSLEVDKLAQQPSQIAEKYSMVDNCPILLDLGRQPTCGIIGDRSACIAIGKNLVVQAATHHSYNDLRIIVICDEDERETWSFCRWLPHLFDDTRSVRYFADSQKQAAKLLGYFDDVLAQRSLENRSKDHYVSTTHSPYYLFICASATLVGSHPIMKHLTSNNRDLGAGAVFLFDTLGDLPKDCNHIVDLTGRVHEVYEKDTASSRQTFVKDAASFEQYDAFARALAPLRVDLTDKGGVLPTNVSFLQGYGAKTPQMLDLSKNWANAFPEQGMAVPIGIKRDGSAFMFDIHEKHSGPHGLVAGMTGSGKSEMVQSWILSMAVRYPPSAVSFVLIDFKGTGLLLPFKNLPHLAGTISDLDTNIGRNLIALENELTRRKALLDRYQVSNISAYLKLVRQGKATESLPYLFIVIDEFAEFKVRFPDFMQAVNRVFAIGRTLGVHMILLTQKPANIVDDKMSANTRFRWCLKVANSTDSRDMLHHTDAAKITNPGRAFVQVGEDEIFEEIQSYWSGAPYNPYRDLTLQRSTKVTVVDYYGNRVCYEPEKTTGYRAEKNEIDVVVDYIDSFARQNNVDRAKAIWTSTLPSHLSLNDLLNHGFDGERWSDTEGTLRPIIGLLDDPRSQSQYPYYIDFAADGHLAIYGAPGSGKTTLLHTTILSLALSYSPSKVNLYMMDFGGGSLTLFSGLPHVGGIAVGGRDDEKIRKLAELISNELDQRKNLLSKHGLINISSYCEATGNALPFIVLLLDNFAPVLDLYPDLDNFFQTLVRDGGGCGIYFVATASGLNALGYRVSQNMKAAIALRMPDKHDYATIVGKTNGLEPEDRPGRGLVRNSPPLELQVALPTDGRSEVERVKNIHALSQLMYEKWDGHDVVSIPTMPSVIRVSDYAGDGVFLGLQHKDYNSIAWDATTDPFLVISSHGEQYASTSFVMDQLLQKYNISTQIKFDTAIHSQQASLFDQQIADLMPTLQGRKEQASAGSFDPATCPYILIVLDDLKACFESASNETIRRLTSIVTMGVGLNVILVVNGSAADIEKLHHVDAFTMNLVKQAKAILIGDCPQSHRAFTTNLSYSEGAAKLTAYDAVVVDSGTATKIKLVQE